MTIKKPSLAGSFLQERALRYLRSVCRFFSSSEHGGKGQLSQSSGRQGGSSHRSSKQMLQMMYAGMATISSARSILTLRYRNRRLCTDLLNSGLCNRGGGSCCRTCCNRSRLCRGLFGCGSIYSRKFDLLLTDLRFNASG